MTRFVMYCGLPLLACALGCAELAPWSWQQSHAVVDPRGGLAWAPEPYRFTAEGEIRCIDYTDGNDAADGTREQPWKHHPWDDRATGRAAAWAGPATFIFKGGVTYRGRLEARESGQAMSPIRLCRDPAWGDGPAVINGASPVTAAWRRTTDARFPAATLWVCEPGLAQRPRRLWSVAADGAFMRLDLAREPDRDPQADPRLPRSDWAEWQAVEQLPDGRARNRASAPAIFSAPAADAYAGATVWTGYPAFMGTPYATPIAAYAPATGAVDLESVWYGGGPGLRAGERFLVEDHPRLLDRDGEWWFDTADGRLYLAWPEDPAGLRLEAAQDLVQISIRDRSHILISGLDFVGSGVWDPTQRSFEDPNVLSASVRAIGTCRDLRIVGNRFRAVATAVRLHAAGSGDRIDDVLIADNDISDADHAAIQVLDGSAWGQSGADLGSLGEVRILRNRARGIGLRPGRSEHGHAITLSHASLAEVAGNIIERCGGAGIFCFGGKGADRRDAPLVRLLIHHNAVRDSLLMSSDWGGIEAWQGGPIAIWANISGGALGSWDSYRRDLLAGERHSEGPMRESPVGSSFGFAYYLDGAYQSAVFSNLAWSYAKDGADRLASTAACMETMGFQNAWFNNTLARFPVAFSNFWGAKQGMLYLGNRIEDLGLHLYYSPLGADDPLYAWSRIAWSGNLVSGRANPMARFGAVRGTVAEPADLPALRQLIAAQGGHHGEVGTLAEGPLLADPAAGDFRPAGPPGRAARVFVPWGLHREVGRWHFRAGGPDGLIPGEHWHLDPAHRDRDMYHRLPRHDLRLVGDASGAWIDEPYENWCASALRFDGRSLRAELADADLEAPVVWQEKDAEQRIATREHLDAGTGNLLIECILRLPRDGGAGILLAKQDATAGWRIDCDAAGRLRLGLRGNGIDRLARSTARGLRDDAWHHVVVEIDRLASDSIRWHIDGIADNAPPEGRHLPSGWTLDNAGDLHLAGTPNGGHLAVDLAFLRLARGTLAESRTSLAELRAWQFDGPPARDFAGRLRQSGDPAGALAR